jgi:hypothetical protein
LPIRFSDVTLHEGPWPKRFAPAPITVDVTGNGLDLMGRSMFEPLAVPTTVCSWEDAPTAWLEPATKLVVER